MFSARFPRPRDAILDRLESVVRFGSVRAIQGSPSTFDQTLGVLRTEWRSLKLGGESSLVCTVLPPRPVEADHTGALASHAPRRTMLPPRGQWSAIGNTLSRAPT